VPSSWIATILDQEQIELTNAIAPRTQDVQQMPDREGKDIGIELGGRLLVRYLVESQVDEFLDGSLNRGHWVTTTAIAPEDVVHWLHLVAPRVPRRHALLLYPAKISIVRGPAWIEGAPGLEYYLPIGFPKEAIFTLGAFQVR
jgi:hypothetical protein